ncbi:DUF4136 domain-containing protein [Sphingobium subterraneum]|uniref:DUF4136 domain-containing protein n=1 Tax=Sphingobium subterraneum TaxID=627688 RepID=A0A841J1V1_9SPHN|nr:DUF4136 domain-containing protein [Sphingobium subterraneum]MBB6124332.1 hypothetical protein [Sphingobium subterraneum]
MALARRLTVLLVPALALVALSGCASNFNANVSRFQQLPAPQGQSFTVVADDPRLAGGLEFAQYAQVVAARLGNLGYRPSADPATADLIVRLRYDVDQGREKVRSTGFSDPFYGPGWYGRGWGRYPGYYGRPYGWGFYDPFLFGGGYNDVESYTVYTGMLEMRIDKAGSGQRVFEGKAEAQSLSNRLTYLVPNLIDAMFVDFPGHSGETVKITLAPEKKK